MIIELEFDVARETLQPAAQHPKILTEVFDSQSVGLGVMTPDRLFSRFDQSARKFLADLVRAVVDDPSKLIEGYALKAAAVG